MHDVRISTQVIYIYVYICHHNKVVSIAATLLLLIVSTLRQKTRMMARSIVERKFLEMSRWSDFRIEPIEKLDILVASSFPELGKLTALQFLEFVQQNPTGVVSLPTGKTPEYFI